LEILSDSNDLKEQATEKLRLSWDQSNRSVQQGFLWERMCVSAERGGGGPEEENRQKETAGAKEPYAGVVENYKEISRIKM